MFNGHKFEIIAIIVNLIISLVVWLALRNIHNAERNIEDATRDIRSNTQRIGTAETERATIRAEIENIKDRNRELRDSIARQWELLRQVEREQRNRK